MTFRQCAEDYLAVNASRWRDAKHRKEWLATLTRYAYPVFGNLSVAAIDSGWCSRLSHHWSPTSR